MVDQYGNYIPDNMQQNALGYNVQQPRITKTMIINAFRQAFQMAGVTENNIFKIDDSSHSAIRHACCMARNLIPLPRNIYTIPGTSFQIPYYLCEYCKRGYYNPEDIPNPNEYY